MATEIQKMAWPGSVWGLGDEAAFHASVECARRFSILKRDFGTIVHHPQTNQALVWVPSGQAQTEVQVRMQAPQPIFAFPALGESLRRLVGLPPSVPADRVFDVLAARQRGRQLAERIEAGEIECRVVTDDDDERLLADFIDRQ